MNLLRTMVLILLLTLAVPATANAESKSRFAKVYDAVFVDRNLPVILDAFLSGEDRRREVLCMSLNVYHEARGSTSRDQEAVAHVTKNRVGTGLWGNTVCAVVLARSQFSWTTFSEGRTVPRETQAWIRAQETAYRVYSDETAQDLTNGATHFYAASMRNPPAWASRGISRQRIGQHVYVRMPTRRA